MNNVAEKDNMEILAEKVVYLKSMGCERLYPIETRLEEYSPYFKSEEELNEWAYFEQHSRESEQLNSVIDSHVLLESKLMLYKAMLYIDSYEFKNNEYIVQASKYEINLKVLHFGDVAQYTVNRNTNKVGNHLRGMKASAFINNLERFL